MKRKRGGKFTCKKANPGPLKSSKGPQSQVYCLFCYKTASTVRNRCKNDDDTKHDRITSCRKFYNQVLPTDNANSPENKENLPDIWNQLDSLEPQIKKKLKKDQLPSENIYGACNDCIIVIKMCSDVFQQIDELQRDLRGHLESIYRIMKYASKVGSRVTAFKDSFFPNTEDHREKESRLEEVLKVRQKIYRSCKTRLNSKRETVPKKPENHKIPDNQINSPNKKRKIQPDEDDDPIEVVGVVKQEVEEVTLNLHPELYPPIFPNDQDDMMSVVVMQEIQRQFPFANASWMDEQEENGGGSYQCSKCSEAFSTEEELIRHGTEMKHLEEGPPEDPQEKFSCHFCSFICTQMGDLVEHEIRLHSETDAKAGGPNAKKVKCPRCTKPLGNRRFDRTRHYAKWHLKLEPFQAKCSDCPEILTGMTQKQANGRLKTHCVKFKHCFKRSKKAGENLGKRRGKYWCGICNKRQGSQSRLEAHLRGHEKVKKAKCWFCEKQFATESGLERHLKQFHRQFA